MWACGACPHLSSVIESFLLLEERSYIRREPGCSPLERPRKIHDVGSSFPLFVVAPIARQRLAKINLPGRDIEQDEAEAECYSVDRVGMLDDAELLTGPNSEPDAGVHREPSKAWFARDEPSELGGRLALEWYGIGAAIKRVDALNRKPPVGLGIVESEACDHLVPTTHRTISLRGPWLRSIRGKIDASHELVHLGDVAVVFCKKDAKPGTQRSVPFRCTMRAS